MQKQNTAIIASAVSDRSYYIRLNDGRLVMIDMGCVDLTEKTVDWAQKFSDYMAELQKVAGSQKITVAALFITHPHDDHLNFLENLKKSGLYQNFDIQKVIRNFPPIHRRPNSGWEKIDYPDSIEELLNSLAADGTQIITAKKGMVFEFGDTKFEILLTPDEVTGEVKDMNYFSLLIRQTTCGKTVLWTGDMSNALSEIAIQTYGDDLKCHILQVPHHGTPNCGVMEFFKICNADVHLWTIAKQTFTDKDYMFALGKYEIPTEVYNMPQKKVFCRSDEITEIIL